MSQHEHRNQIHRPSWSYAEFVRSNPGGARALESLLQYAGFFAPSRLGNRDLAIETGYAAASLAALVHGHILRDNGGFNRGGVHVVTGDLHHTDMAMNNREGGQAQEHRTRSVGDKERLRVALSVLTYIQIVVEKIAVQAGGDHRRRQAISCIEVLKAIFRLLLLTQTRDMTLGGGTVRVDTGRRRTWPGASLLRHSASDQSALGIRRGDSTVGAPEHSPAAVYTGRRSGVRMTVPASLQQQRVSSCLGGGVGKGREGGGVKFERLGSTALSPPPWDRGGMLRKVRGGEGELSGERGCMALGEVDGSEGTCPAQGEECRRGQSRGSLSQGWLMAGEVVHVLRPVVYSLCCGRFGERSWHPWLISLGMDALAYACTSRAGNGSFALLLPLPPQGGRLGEGGQRSSGGVTVLQYLDTEQAAELRRRKLQWLFYVLRSPAFELLVRPAAREVAGVFEGVPLVGGLASYALNMLLYVQRHHFYISAS
ncbi:unnamed protein product [Choristocarpus tenellus]